MRHFTEYFECGVTGITTGPVDNDVDEGSDDPQTPPGWISMVAVRVIPNPAYRAPRTVEEVLASQIGHLEGEQRAQAEQILTPLAKLQAEATDTEPEFLVEECSIHVHPDAANQVFALDREAFEDAGWFEPLAPSSSDTDVSPAPAEPVAPEAP